MIDPQLLTHSVIASNACCESYYYYTKCRPIAAYRSNQKHHVLANLQNTYFANENVPRGKISMDNPHFLQVLHATRDLTSDLIHVVFVHFIYRIFVTEMNLNETY